MKTSQQIYAERVKLILSMEYIMRNLNDENDFEQWLMFGVPDGDIPYGAFETGLVDEFYVLDEDCFKTILGTFIDIIKRMDYDGITCGNITSPTKEEIYKLYTE